MKIILIHLVHAVNHTFLVRKIVVVTLTIKMFAGNFWGSVEPLPFHPVLRRFDLSFLLRNKCLKNSDERWLNFPQTSTFNEFKYHLVLIFLLSIRNPLFKHNLLRKILCNNASTKTITFWNKLHVTYLSCKTISWTKSIP